MAQALAGLKLDCFLVVSYVLLSVDTLIRVDDKCTFLFNKWKVEGSFGRVLEPFSVPTLVLSSARTSECGAKSNIPTTTHTTAKQSKTRQFLRNITMTEGKSEKVTSADLCRKESCWTNSFMVHLNFLPEMTE